MDAPSAINPLELFVPLVEGTRSLKHLILDIRPESVLHSIPGLVDFISKISGSLDTLYIDGDFGESLADVLASQALKRHKLSILTYKGILSDHEQVEVRIGMGS
jgi:hypothetical protein